MAFVADGILEGAGFDPAKTRILFGVSATAVLLLSITEFRVDWKAKAAEHGDAVKRLAALKAEYRKALDAAGDHEKNRAADLEDAYSTAMRQMRPVPERRFAHLKAAHEFKIVLSQKVSANPKAPTWFLRALLRWEGVRAAWNERGK